MRTQKKNAHFAVLVLANLYLWVVPFNACADVAVATPATPTHPVMQEKRKEINVRQLSPIAFGNFAAAKTNGSIAINATNGARTAMGVALLNGGNSGPAEFDIMGQPDEQVMLMIPDSIMMDKEGGGAGLVIANLKIFPGESVTLDNTGRARVKVGATLKIPANVVPGPYNGYFTIDARYVR